MASSARSRRSQESGYAIILAIVVLAALVAIATPFLLATRGSARSSAVRSGDIRARIEADAALRAVLRRLEATDPEVDPTPSYDTDAEVRVRLELPKDLYAIRDPKGVVVSASAEPEQIRVNVNGASIPGIGLLFPHSFLVGTLQKEATEIAVESADAFPNEGFVWIEGELIRYRSKAGGKLSECERGVMGSKSGPYEEAGEHKTGAAVVDARAHHVAKHRIRVRPGQFTPFETVGELTRTKVEPDGCPPITTEDLWKQSSRVSVFSERNGHAEWSAPWRIVGSIQADGLQRSFIAESSRYMGIGSTVKIEGPEGIEYGIVCKNTGDSVTLEEPLTLSAQAYQAKVSVLLPSPIHLNSAPAELLEELFVGLSVKGAATPEPIPRDAAKELARKIKETEPIGVKDLLERVLLPLVKDNTLTFPQVEAVVRNGENSNDALLRHSTLPFVFAAGSRFRAIASASVNAPSGAERGRDEIECVAEVHRQNHSNEEVGIRAVGRQIDFDEMFRLSRRARGWMTYPWNSSYFDGRADPPSRVKAYFAGLTQLSGAVPVVQSEDPKVSWAQLWPSRSAYPDDRSEHFDAEIGPEGRDVAKFQAWATDPGAKPAELAGGAGGYLYPGSFSGWFRWDGGALGGTLFDLGSKDSYLRDRITLSIDQGDLVLRMRDPCGDDTNNIAGEIKNEIRFPTTGQFQPHVWYHFLVAFRGSGPGDFALFIDGIPRGKRGLLTTLTDNLAGISQPWISTTIPVESTEGFPGYGVLEIGDELVEYTGKTPKSFSTGWTTGQVPGSYTGGRGIRYSKTNSNTTHSHQSGEVVKLYGYTSRILRDVHPGGGQLTTGIGPFSAGKVKIQQNFGLAPIDAVSTGVAFPAPLGFGIEADTALPTLRLDPLDPIDTTFIKAFPPTGGYAVMFQFSSNGNLKTPAPKNSQLFGAELIYFSGVQGNDTLVGITRNVQPGGSSTYFGPCAFVVKWANNVPQNHNNNDYRFWTYVVPVSLPVSTGDYYKPANPNNDYGIVQLIELGAAGVGLTETTEWCQYDTVLNGHFCALADWRMNAMRSITLGPPQVVPNLPGQQPPFIIQFGGSIPQQTPAAVTHTPAQSAADHYLGMPPTKPIAGLVDQMLYGTAANASGMRFRSTDRTWTREHVASTEVIPAFITKLGSNAAGRPGRLDRFRIVLPKGVNGFDHRTINWTSLHSAGTLWVATAEKLPNTLLPVPTTGVIDPEYINNQTLIEDSRDWLRIVCGPSGELPAVASTLTVGGPYDNSGPPFGGTLDEIEFTSVPVGQRTLSLGRHILAQACTAAETSITLAPAVAANPFNPQQNPIVGAVSFPGTTKALSSSVMGTLPGDAGVLLVGAELIGYDKYDPASGVVTVASGGRGILGTEARAHGAYETAVFLESVAVSQLSGGMSSTSSVIEVEDPAKFPPFGTVLVDDELVHFTRNTGARLEMPEFEEDDWGNADSQQTGVAATVRKGNGLFRARYGTVANTHATGRLAFRFPFRYWDRWVLGTDAPEISYLGCDEEAQAAFWRRVFWVEEQPVPGVSIECLARLDARSRWSAEANKADGLWLFTSPSATKDAKNVGMDGNPVLRQGERLELRFGVRYGSNAFEPIAAPTADDVRRSDSWKTTPKIRGIAVERFAGNRVLWKEERR